MPHVTGRIALIGLLAGGLGLALLAAQVPAPTASPDAREEAYRANNLGVAYLEQYNYEQAAANFRRALALQPTLTLARVNLAIALLYAPDPAGAAREAQAALAAQPDSRQARYVLGLAARGENRVDDGVAAFRAVLSADPEDPGALVNLGQLLLQQQKFDEASELFRKAIAAEPYNATAMYNLGVALLRGGKQEEGQRYTAQFQKLRESGYAVTYSSTYLEQGRYAEALASTGAEPDLVDRTTPAVTFTRRAVVDALPGPPTPSAAGDAVRVVTSTGFTLVDYDRDDDLDLVDVDLTHKRVRLFKNDDGMFTDVSEATGLTRAIDAIAPLAVVAGDYDNDGRPDLLVTGVGGQALLHQTQTGTFQRGPVSGAGLPIARGSWTSAAFVDVDHDGDLDIVLLTANGATINDPPSANLPLNNRLLRNNGDNTFTDITADAKLDVLTGRGGAIVPTDYDNRRDIDLLFLYDDRPVLFRNMRDGTFHDVAAGVGLTKADRPEPERKGIAIAPPAEPYSAVAAGDVNKDGFTDFFFGRGPLPAALFLSDGNGRFRAVSDGPSPTDVAAAQFVDYDNDGLLDLIGLTPSGLFLWRNVGSGWIDITDTALKEANVRLLESGTPSRMVAGDVDRDGDTDLIIKSTIGKLTILTNDGGNRHASLRLRLTGQNSNRLGLGAKVDIRAGSLRQKLELASTTPAVAPADLIFGLGARQRADVVRVIWPSGTVQAEPLAADTKAVLGITELDRKPSSCPFLYTWNGQRFEFITDFMGGGEMGYLEAPGVHNVPDPEEYTRITDAQLQPRAGRYELRVTNELEETLYVDRLRLLAVAHPDDVEIYPREGLVSPPFPAFELIAAANIHAPARVIDHDRRDVTEQARFLDRRFIDRLPLERIRGYAKPHDLTIDLGAEPADLLLLTGWTDYAFSSDNLAASHAGLRLEPPSLAVQDRAGAWRTVMDEIGLPVGRPQTIVVDLKDKWLSHRRLVRIHTSMRVYWDQVRVATRDRAFEPTITALDPVSATLRWRGFSAEATRREPFTYDYARVSFHAPWKEMPGRYTREGDVRPLLAAADEMFVIARPGDEIALSFDAASTAVHLRGWTRTFLLHSDGFSKEMDLHSASPDQAWPLPFHGMTRYPYVAPEAYPLTPERQAYLDHYNTRRVARELPSLDAASAARSQP